MFSISIKRSVALIATGVAFLLLTVSSACADFGFTANSGVAITGPDGQFTRQAGAHADLDVHFEFNRRMSADGSIPIPDDNARDVTVDLPPGVVGNPTVAPTCSYDDLLPAGTDLAQCPISAQIGIAHISASSAYSPPYDINVAVYNMPQPADAPGLFAFNYAGAAVEIKPRLRPGDYGISTDTTGVTQALPPFRADIELWGVPADPSHDAERMNPAASSFGTPSPDRRKAFLTTSTSCSGQPSVFTISADSWQNPGYFVGTSVDQDPDGVPFTNTGCDKLPFEPSISVQPLSHSADAPTGLDVGLDVPQSDNPDGLATAHVKRVALTLPQGMSVSPSSAAGLGACAEDQIKLGTDADPTCPDSSKIGSVTINTPLLEEPLTGDVILAQPNANPFGTLLAIYLVAKGPGVIIKLPGEIDTDPDTGQLTAVFDNNPQLPFTHLDVRFRGGSQAALATPAVCGTYTTNAAITSWASETPVLSSSSMTIDQNCGTSGFNPSFSAGVTNPIAGASSPFTLTFSRQDGEQNLKGLTATMPPGLIGDVASVPLCPEAQAAAGTCSAASRVGNTTILSGSGAAPISVPMAGKAPTAVYLAGPYKGAPFSLSIVVPAQAGPFDLGTVVVRAALFIDRHDAHITVVSDPLPTILQGIPLRIRQVTVDLDRPGFMLTPTSCAAMAINATITSTQGASVPASSHFQVTNCANLPFKPVLTASTTGRASKPAGASLDVKIASGVGMANIAAVKVDLPKQLPSRLTTLQKACLATVFDANPASCPAASNVGTATAVTPVLSQPLSGPAYLVSHGGAAFPDLEIVLQGEGVTLVLDGNTSIKKGITSSTFKAIPDAPIKSFELKLPTGKYSALGTNLPQSAKYNLCGQTLAMPTAITAQNGATIKQTTKIAVSGCPKAKKTTRKKTKKVGTKRKRTGGKK